MSRSTVQELRKALDGAPVMVSRARWCEVHLVLVDRRDGETCAVARRIARSESQVRPLECCIVAGWWVIRELCE